jgi:hypothetical protein
LFPAWARSEPSTISISPGCGSGDTQRMHTRLNGMHPPVIVCSTHDGDTLAVSIYVERHLAVLVCARLNLMALVADLDNVAAFRVERCENLMIGVVIGKSLADGTIGIVAPEYLFQVWSPCSWVMDLSPLFWLPGYRRRN